MWVAILYLCFSGAYSGRISSCPLFCYGLEPMLHRPRLHHVSAHDFYAPSGGAGRQRRSLLLPFCGRFTPPAVSLLEVVVAFCRTEPVLCLSRLVFLLCCSLFWLRALAFPLALELTASFSRPDIFDFLDYVCTNFLMTINGLVRLLLWSDGRLGPKAMKELSTCRRKTAS